MINRRAIFIDRDGVINKKMPEDDYVKNWDEFHFLPGVFKALKLLKRSDFLLILITNQRSVAKKIISIQQLNQIHKKMQLTIIKQGGRPFDAIYFCPHEKNSCNCRKPKPGMVLSAIDDFRKKEIEIDLQGSYFIDDNPQDIIMGKNLGLICIKIGYICDNIQITKKNLLEAIHFIKTNYSKDILKHA